MKTETNNSPFTVPEGFFEQVQSRAEDRAGRIIRRRRCLMGAVCACILAAAVVPFGLHQKSEMDALAAAYEYNQILDSYEYDIFLNNFSLSE